MRLSVKVSVREGLGDPKASSDAADISPGQQWHCRSYPYCGKCLGPLLLLQLWACGRARMGHSRQNSDKLYCALDFFKINEFSVLRKQNPWSQLRRTGLKDLMCFTGINSNRDFQTLLFSLKGYLQLLQIVSKGAVTLKQNLYLLWALNKQNCQFVLGLGDTFRWWLGTENKYEISSLSEQFVHPEHH